MRGVISGESRGDGRTGYNQLTVQVRRTHAHTHTPYTPMHGPNKAENYPSSAACLVVISLLIDSRTREMDDELLRRFAPLRSPSKEAPLTSLNYRGTVESRAAQADEEEEAIRRIADGRQGDDGILRDPDEELGEDDKEVDSFALSCALLTTGRGVSRCSCCSAAYRSRLGRRCRPALPAQGSQGIARRRRCCLEGYQWSRQYRCPYAS